MEIECKNCHYAYSYERYGAQCPKCGTANEPFRSAAARRAMGCETDSLRDRYFTDAHEERQKALYKETGPFAFKGKGPAGPLRRLRPYLFILILMCGVAMLGSALMQMSKSAWGEGIYAARRSAAQSGEAKPLIESLASNIFQTQFNPVSGVTVTATCAGYLPEEPKLESLLQGGEGVFVNLVAEAETPGTSLPGLFFARIGEIRIDQELFYHAAEELDQYTPLSKTRFAKEGSVMGQVFFALPPDTEEFYLCWLDTGENVEQRMKIRLGPKPVSSDGEGP